MLYSSWSSNARSSFSGGIDGRPVVEYKPVESRRQARQRRVGHLANRSQRMIRVAPALPGVT